MTSTDTGAKRITMKAPRGFDPDRHGTKVLELIEARHGEGFRIVSFNEDKGELVAVREAQIATFTEREGQIHVELPLGTSAADGPKFAAQAEAQKPGWRVVDFQPYAKPGFATMQPLSEEESRVRDALAQVMRVAKTPWQVKVAARVDGGFDFVLPSAYSPAAHDEKLLEVAETAAGEPGWFAVVDPKTLIGKILPGELPTFPTVIPYPLERDVPAFAPGDTRWTRIPLGVALGKPGEPVGPEFCVNLKSASHTLLQGLPMSGKSVNLNATIYWWLMMGGELAILDTPDKAVDFEWARPFVREGGWGPESYAQMVATAGLVYDEGRRRAAILKRKGVTNWFDLRGEESFKPILLIADEYTGLMTKDTVPTSLPKDHPMRMEAEEKNGFKDMIGSYVQKIALEMRFVGVHVLVSTQLGNTKTGVSVALKNASGNRLLMGPNASDNQRGNAFAAPDAVARVPENVRSAEGVSKGVGTTETEGQPSVVFKGYFAQVSDFLARIESEGRAPRCAHPDPSRVQIAEYIGDDDLDDEGSSGAMAQQVHGGRGFGGGRSTSEGMNIAREMGLSGAAAANFAGRYDQQQAAGA